MASRSGKRRSHSRLAFGEAAKALQVTGPTIRVPQGTTIVISVHSSLGVPVTLHGLHQRPGSDSDVVTVNPGAGLLLMNGMPQPATMRLQAGTTYRFRFMNITPTMDNMRVSLRGAAGPVEWRLLAKDAANVKSPAPQKADQRIAVGETFDFEYRATAAGELRLEGWSPGDNRRAVQTLVFTEP